MLFYNNNYYISVFIQLLLIIDENLGENMLKKSTIIVLFCMISSFAFAQTAPKQVLSEKDLNGFIANYEKIMAAFDEIGDKYDDLFKGLDEGNGFSGLIKMRSIAVPQEIQDVLKKNGLGDNGFEKAMVIIQGFGVIGMEEDFDSLSEEAAKDPKIADYVKEARKDLKVLKDSIHTKDLALIANKKEELFNLLQ